MRISTILLSWLLRRKILMDEKEIRTVNISTTSNGEDLFLADYFSGEKGAYLEIGCNHPRLYNLTYNLYGKGWRGVCVDPNPLFAGEFKKKRSRDVFLNSAMGDPKTCFTYHEYVYDQLNHLTVSGSPPRPQGQSKLIQSSSIPTLSWMDLMGMVRSEFKAFDLLLIDAECQSTELLVTAPSPEFLSPKVIVVEAPSDLEVSRCKEKLEPLGYLLLLQFPKSGNLYFFR